MNDWPDRIPKELDEEFSTLSDGCTLSNQKIYELFTNWSFTNEYGYKGSDTIPLNEKQLRRMIVAQGVVNETLKGANSEHSLFELMDTIKKEYKSRLDTIDIDAAMSKRGVQND